MKKQKNKLTLDKLRISKLTNLSIIIGGTGIDDGDDHPTIKSGVPVICKNGNGNVNE